MINSAKNVKGFCSDFCLCASVSVSEEQVNRIVEFIWSKSKKPTLPNKWYRYLRPEAKYADRYGNFSVEAQINVTYPEKEVLKKTDEILADENIPNKTKEALLTFKKEIPLQARKFEKRAQSNYVTLKINIKPLSYLESPSLTMEVIEKISKNEEKISNMLNLAKETFQLPVNLVTCATFLYDPKKIKPLGGIVLPMPLPISPETSLKIGNAQLYGFMVSLVDSKLGLKDVEISQEGNYLKISTQGEFQLNEFDRFIAKPFELSNEYSNLLVEEI
jgi:hypothetical protein